MSPPIQGDGGRLGGHLIVPCRECGAAVGAYCTYVAARRKGEVHAGGHGIRQDMAQERRTSEETANAIADWLQAMNAPDDRIAKIRDDLATAIRAGKWRASQAVHPGSRPAGKEGK